MALGETFTVLAVLEATDRMSRVLEQVDSSLGRFSETATRAATAATEAGARIDESLLQTASGADALQLADAKVSAAQARVAETTKAQADAERALLAAQSALANAEEGDTEAAARLTAAMKDLSAAQKQSAIAAKEAQAATSAQADVQRATVLSTTEGRAAADTAAASQARLAEQQARAAAGAGIASKAMKYGALAIAAVGYESVKMAGNFESMTEHLVTDAGESQKNIGLIRAGMLALATQTGTTTDQMAAGMYHIESAGFHGQKALDVLKVAAEGAKVGGADLDTIGQALTGTMNAFGEKGGTATQMMNAMIATVGAGDMKMEAFGSSLGNVAAIGASAGLSFAQVAGGVATMTAQNVTAQRATMDLAHTISSLSNPNKVALTEMQAMGVNALDLQKNLGKRGLTGTFDLLVQAIAAHTKGGQVFINALDKSKVAASQATQALAAMPPEMKKLAAGWQAGTVSTKTFQAAIAQLPPAQQTLYTQFESLVKKSGSFTDALKANNPVAQSFNAALSKMAGGSTSLNTILMLSGQHAQTFKDNVSTIAGAASKTGSEVDNWSAIQSTFNQKMQVAKAAVEAAGVSIGTALLPFVTKLAGILSKILTPIASWISTHQKLTGIILGSLVTFAALAKTISMVSAAVELLGLAIDGTPIGMIIVSVGLLVAGFMYLWTHVKGFRDFWIGVWNVIKTVLLAAWHSIEAVWNALVAAAKFVASAFSAAFDAVAAVAQTVWGVISAVWNTIVSVTTAVWNGISGFFQKWWPLLLVIFATPIAAIIGLWNHTHQAIFDTAKTVWNAISGFFVGVWHLITSATQTAWNLFKTYVITPIQAVWAWIQPVIHNIESFLSGVWHQIVSVVQTMWGLVKTYIIKPITDAWNWLTGWIGKFVQIGTNIVQGIINGLEGAASWLMNQVSNLANKALSAAKSALGIGSPSREFANQVGKWIPHGIAAGVNEHAHVAHAAVAALSKGLTAAAQTSLTGSFTASLGGGIPALAGGAGVGGGVSINVDLRNSQVSNPNDAQQLATTVGKEIVKQLARAGIKTRTY